MNGGSRTKRYEPDAYRGGQRGPTSGYHDGAGDDEDRRLIEASRTDRDAVAALYRRHVQAVYAHAFRICGSKEVAEEATSATFEKALTVLADFEWRDGGIRPWLLRIAGNEVAGSYRKRARDDAPRSQLALRELAAEPVAPSEVAEEETRNAQVLAQMRAALPQLATRYREVIELRYLTGLTATQAADQLGCSKPVLAVTLHRALGALRRELAQPMQGGRP